MFKTKPFKWAAILAIVLMAVPVAMAGRSGLVYHEVEVVDEHGRAVTDISTVTIRLSGTTNAATIYKDSARTLAITQPMTTGSTNTTLSNGKFYWYGPDAWDYTLGDGTNTMTNFGHASFNSSNGQIVFPTFIAAVSSTAYTDAQNATFGSDSDFVLAAGANDNRFTFTPAVADESAAIWFGYDTAGVDTFMYAATTGDYIQWDASDEQLEAVGASILVDDGNIALGDGDYLLFGDTLGTGDFKISDQTDVLVIDVVVAGTGEIEIGNDADDVPMKWYGETTGDFVYFTGDDLQLEDISLCIAESTQIQFGDALGTGDITLSCTSNVFTIGQVVAGTGEVRVGVDDAGLDFKFFGDTASQYLLWDTSEDTLTGSLGNVLFTTNDAEANQFKVDAVGTVAGYAIVLETTDGGVQINSDGAANGDISIDAADDLTLVAAGDLTATVTGSTTLGKTLMQRPIITVGGATYTLLAADSGAVVVTTAGVGTQTVTLPTAAAGLTFTFVDISATADEDLAIQAGAGDSINGGTAAKQYENSADAVPATVTLTATDADNWVVTSEAGTWINDNS